MARFKVTVVGAGNVGATAAQRLVERGIADVVLTDILEGVPQGKALDLLQSGPTEGYNTSIVGTNDYKDIAGSDVVLVTAGFPRQPGMSRSDLLQKNAEIVKGIGENIKQHAPNSIVVTVTNPLDVMTYLMMKVTGFAPNRVVGMAGVLDSARFRTFIAMELKMAATDVDAMVLGGHGDSMVPMTRFSTVYGVSIENLIAPDRLKAIVDRTRNGGAEIVNLLKKGSAYYAPASSAVEMVMAILRDEKRLLPCASFCDGVYGMKDLYIGVPVVLGKGGVEKTIQLNLTKEELAALQESGGKVKADIETMRGLVKF